MKPRITIKMQNPLEFIAVGDITDRGEPKLVHCRTAIASGNPDHIKDVALALLREREIPKATLTSAITQYYQELKRLRHSIQGYKDRCNFIQKEAEHDKNQLHVANANLQLKEKAYLELLKQYEDTKFELDKAKAKTVSQAIQLSDVCQEIPQPAPKKKSFLRWLFP